jgi:hypothetical protein
MRFEGGAVLWEARPRAEGVVVAESRGLAMARNSGRGRPSHRG